MSIKYKKNDNKRNSKIRIIIKKMLYQRRSNNKSNTYQITNQSLKLINAKSIINIKTSSITRLVYVRADDDLDYEVRSESRSTNQIRPQASSVKSPQVTICIQTYKKHKNIENDININDIYKYTTKKNKISN